MNGYRNASLRLKALARNERGMVAPMIAVLGVSLLMATALALDVGLYYAGDRNLRNAAEAAALAAAMNPGAAEQRAKNYFRDNGYPEGSLKSLVVTPGYYCANKGLDIVAGQSRFVTVFQGCPGGTQGQNAVRVTATKLSRQFLTGLFGSASPIPELNVTASAARIDEAGVAITSDILRLTSGGITASLVTLVNNVLGTLLGVQLNLSAPDIQALMAGNVDAGLFFDSLAQRTNQSGTYGEMMSRSYGMRDIALAGADAAYAPATAAALRTFGAVVSNSYQVPFMQNNVPLFGLGVWKNMPVGEASVKPALRAGMNAYQLIAFAAQAGPGAIDVSNVVGLAIPGSTVRIAAVTNGAMAQPRFSFGAVGEARVSTSQVRIKLNIGLGNISLLGNLLEVKPAPVLIDIAPATANISEISCQDTSNQLSDTVVKIHTTSGLVKAYIADIPDSVMSKQMSEVTPINPATLIGVDLGILSVKATAKVVAGTVTGNESDLYFGPNGSASSNSTNKIGTIGTPNSPGRSVNLGNGSQVGKTIGNLVGGVAGGVDVKIKLLNLVDIGLQNSVLGSLVTGIITPLNGLVSTTVGTTVDPLLDNLLAALGIQLGDATVWAT